MDLGLMVVGVFFAIMLIIYGFKLVENHNKVKDNIAQFALFSCVLLFCIGGIAYINVSSDLRYDEHSYKDIVRYEILELDKKDNIEFVTREIHNDCYVKTDHLNRLSVFSRSTTSKTHTNITCEEQMEKME